jgi:1-acyl-sn-glycerol-3-phosphate acyltransferase
MGQRTQTNAQQAEGDARHAEGDPRTAEDEAGNTAANSQKENRGATEANGDAQRAASKGQTTADKPQESLISERASRYSLAGPDWRFMEVQKYFWNPLMDYWFRMQVEGWEKIPEPPALLVGIHSGAPLVWDAWTVGVQWWRHYGRSRPLHGTAHDLLMALPLLGDYFRRMGVLPARPESITAALERGHDVALWPGGERDSLRPWVKRDQAILAGRKGFVRLAIRTGVPIVPIATVGGADAMPVLASGRRLAKALRLDKVARLKTFPIALQLPWGISPALLPEVPLPTKIRTAFQDPITVDADPDKAGDDQYVKAIYDEVCASIQAGMDALARRRRLPLFG